jgi:MFS family permease
MQDLRMTSRAPDSRFFYGWIIVGVAVVSMAFWFGVRTMFSVFLVALVDEFGWGRGETSGVQSLAMICYIAAAPVAGWLVDRFGPRRVIVPGIVLLAAGIALGAWIHRLFHFYIFFGLMAGIGVTFVSLSTYMAIIPHWFEKRRGTASGISSSGMGLGILVFVPLSQALITRWGWRFSFLILGIATAAILLPLNGLLLRHKPQDMGYAGPEGRRSAAPEPKSAAKSPPATLEPNFQWGLREAARTLNFWALMIFPMLSMIGIYTVSVHFVGFLVNQGLDKMKAASALAMIGVTCTAFRIIWGFISDRIGREKAYTLSMFFFCVSFYCLFQFERSGEMWLVYVFVVLVGIGWGATAPMFMACAADLFHGPAIGIIFGMLEGSVGVGGAFGAWIGGYLFDRSGSYMQAFALAAVTGALSCLFIWMASPRKGAVLKQNAMKARETAS